MLFLVFYIYIYILIERTRHKQQTISFLLLLEAKGEKGRNALFSSVYLRGGVRLIGEKRTTRGKADYHQGKSGLPPREKRTTTKGKADYQGPRSQGQQGHKVINHQQGQAAMNSGHKVKVH